MESSNSMSEAIKAEICKHRYSLHGYKLCYGVIKEVSLVLLKLTDEDGTVGWGEANAQQPFTDEDSDEVIKVLREELLPVVMAQENPELAYIDEALDRIQPNKHLLAEDAINIALFDIQDKRLSVPIAELLGGPIRQPIPVSHPLNNGTAADDIRVIDDKMKEGYIDYMLKMGTSHIVDEIERVTKLEKRYGDRAAEFLTDVADSNLVFVEQLIAKDDIDGMAMLAQSTKLSISADEDLIGMDKAQEIIRKHAANVFSLKVTKNGGILRTKALAELAQGHGMKCFANSMLEGGIMQAASLQLAVAVTNLLPIRHSFRSVLRLVEGEVTGFASNMHDAVVYLPKGPGLGINVDEEKLRTSALSLFVIE